MELRPVFPPTGIPIPVGKLTDARSFGAPSYWKTLSSLRSKVVGTHINPSGNDAFGDSFESAMSVHPHTGC